jgi:hypothetical protein
MNGTGIIYNGMYQAYFKGQWLGASANRMTAWKAIGQCMFKEMENTNARTN